MKTVRHKFNAKITEVDSIKFSSKKEAAYYVLLKNRCQTGEVIFFLRQVPLHLPGNVKYLVDFVEFLSDGSVKFIDVKGCMTPISKIKIKQAEALYPINIILV